MTIGLFGGTFDPIHFGHLRSAVEVGEAFGLEQVVLIPAAVPPHKGRGAMAPAADRLRMIELAVAGAPGLAVSDVELRRAGPSYTIDTVRHFQDQLPAGDIALIMGLDAFSEIDTWKFYREILAAVAVIVISRPAHHQDPGRSARARVESVLAAVFSPEAIEATTEGFRAEGLKSVTVQPVTALDISSTRIRQMIGAGRSIRYLAPAAVVAHIQAKGLYA
ncbi:MAG: nicotinate-nucleotide adenylyltransferase [Desulfobacterales bacterium]|jgi:nicotinate-nucleotide adenylyltransferase|nr:nicotinate-nucleotide adenylyltransferase [Desulfobacterales bacterium]